MQLSTALAISTAVLRVLPGHLWWLRLPLKLKETVTSVVFILSLVAGGALYMLVTSPAPWTAPRAVVFVTAVATSFVLYRLKLGAQILYGLVELAFALAMAWDSAGLHATALKPFLPEDFTPFFKLTAATYLLVRGFENLHKGFGTLVDAAKKDVGGVKALSFSELFKQPVPNEFGMDLLREIASRDPRALDAMVEQVTSKPALQDYLRRRMSEALAKARTDVEGPLQPGNGGGQGGAV